MTGPGPLPFLARARAHRNRVAIAGEGGDSVYADLLRVSSALAGALLRAAPDAGGPAADLEGGRVALMAPPGLAYVAGLWGIWRAGGIALPLCTAHPPRELAYALDDAGAGVALVHPSFEDALGPLARRRGVPCVTTDPEPAGEEGGGPDARGPAIDESRGAMLLYTSGTTSRPKGVLHTHRSLRAQVESLVEAWGWRAEDRILHVLPLHHTHGIVNALLCALWTGAACEMLPAFDAGSVWERFGAGATGRRSPITLFMAVPTVYVKLIAAWEEAPEGKRREWSEAARSLRLTVSGSAALPERTFRRWREITGHDLLERYGMTEIGMALSNPLEGERRPGTVGRPLPGVRLRLVGEGGEVMTSDEGPPPGAGRPLPAAADPPPDAGPGEIRVRGPAVFREYWRRPEATAEAFRDGWFRTGDVAAIESGYWRILGRSSVDIIKSGGYKISALEIEEVLRAHPAVSDCAVVGLPDPEWGERVAAAVVTADEGPAGAREPGDLAEELDAWVRERLAPYKLPRRWLVAERLPRNALGKVRKPDVQALFGDPTAGDGVAADEGPPAEGEW